MTTNKTFIIAEAGVNHNGDIELAKKLVDVAVEAGVDAVKFQTFKAETLVSRSAPKAQYQKATETRDESQFEMLKKLELSDKDHYLLKEYCHSNDIIFLSSPFDLKSIDFLNEIGLTIFKIPSGEITNLPYLRKIGSLGKQVILSTGMSCMEDIGWALSILLNAGTSLEQISVLHCTTQYPTPFKDVNLKAMLTIGSTFGVNFGYSDHTLGIEVAIAAVSLGATIIEKHFTLDNNMSGPDHKASIEPHMLKKMVKSIRNVEIALGSSKKFLTTSETENINIARKSLVAQTDIKIGELFSNQNLCIKRPGTGMSPKVWDRLIGRVATKNYKKHELIKEQI